MAYHKVKAELFDQFARVGQALSSGRRIEILDVLANGERSVGILEMQGRRIVVLAPERQRREAEARK